MSPAVVLLHEVAHSVDKQARIKYIFSTETCPSNEKTCQVTNDPNCTAVR